MKKMRKMVKTMILIKTTKSTKMKRKPTRKRVVSLKMMRAEWRLGTMMRTL